MALLGAVAGSGCGGGGSGDAPDARPPSPVETVARFVAPAPGAGAAWAEIPYPSDLYLDASGHLALTSLPTGEAPYDRMIDLMKQSLAELDGASVRTNVYFGIDGEVDVASLAGNAHLVDLDGGLAEIPATVVWRPDLATVVIAPEPGTVLLADRAYAAYLTAGVLDERGQALVRDDDFEAAWSGSGGSAEVNAAAASLARLRDALAADVRDAVVVATVFRTQTLTDDTVAMRDIIAADPPALVAVDSVITDPAALDDLFGVPAFPASPAGWHEWDPRAQPHDSVAAVVHGRFTFKNFVSETPGLPGLLEHDAEGLPVVQGEHEVDFLLVLPVAASLADVPVVTYLHGLGGGRSDSLSMVDTVTDAGMAMLSFDLPYHGDRYINPRDEKHRTSGDQRPDGFGDRQKTLSVISFFHLGEANGWPANHPSVIRENLRQSALDVASLAAFVRDGDIAALTTAVSEAGLPADLSFHDSLAVIGVSFGSMVGSLAASFEPGIGVLISSGTAAGFPLPAMLHSPNEEAFNGVITRTLDIEPRLIPGDPVYGALIDPIVVLWTQAVEAGDPMAYAPYARTGELRGGSAARMLLMSGWGDDWVTNEAGELYARAMDIPHVAIASASEPPGGMVRYVEVDEMAAPAEVEAALTVWHPGGHGLIENYYDKLIFEPVSPPFVERDITARFRNPAFYTHRLLADFMRDFFAGDPARVYDPYVCTGDEQCAGTDTCASGRCVVKTCDLTFTYVHEGTAPSTVHVAGDFNDWARTAATGALPLAFDTGSGTWTGTFALPAGEHVYKLVLDQGQTILDPTAVTVPSGYNGDSSALYHSCP